MSNQTAPLYEFGQAREKADNKEFTLINGVKAKVGQRVYGSWVDFDGRSYFNKGVIVYYEATGFWIDTGSGITPLKKFWTIFFSQEPKNPPPSNHKAVA
jgi:hypothetical protein